MCRGRTGFLLPSLLLISSVVSCGDSGPAILPAEPSDPARTRVVFLGDSLTEGAGVEPEFAYPAVIDVYWREHGVPYRADNQGVSGDTTADVLGRLRPALTPSALVVVEIGANDAFRNVPLERIRENITSIVRAIQDSGNRVALVEMKFPENMGSMDPATIRQFNRVYAEIARSEKVPLIPFFLQPLFGSAAYWQPDGIHPTAEGHRLLARKVLRDLNPRWNDFR